MIQTTSICSIFIDAMFSPLLQRVTNKGEGEGQQELSFLVRIHWGSICSIQYLGRMIFVIGRKVVSGTVMN